MSTLNVWEAQYNEVIARYIALSAYDSTVLDRVKGSYLSFTPQSRFLKEIVKKCLEENKYVDDVALETVVDREGQAIHEYCINKPVERFNWSEMFKVFQSYISEAINANLEGDKLATRIDHLRSLVKNYHDRIRLLTSVSEARKIIEQGGSAEQAHLAIYTPEVDELESQNSFIETAIKTIIEEKSEPVRTGFQHIDAVGGIDKRNIISIGGDTGCLKTRFSLSLCWNILKSNPEEVVVYFEKEMSKVDIINMTVSAFLNKEISEVKNMQIELLLHELSQLSDEEISILNRFIVVGPNEFGSTADILHMIKKYKAGIWCIDYLTLLAGDGDGMNMEVLNIITDLKKIVHSTNSLGIIINQLRKGTIETRRNKIPLLDDIEWSGRIKQLSSQVWMVFYPFVYMPDISPKRFYVVVRKNRFGGRGYFPFEAHPSSTAFFVPELRDVKLLNSWIQDYEAPPKKKENYD